jgi:hypothetical protein
MEDEKDKTCDTCEHFVIYAGCIHLMKCKNGSLWEIKDGTNI